MKTNITLNAKVNYTICNFYTGWKKETHTGIIKSFHAPGWVTILSGNEVHYIEIKDII